MEIEVCQHCGSELKKASTERQEISLTQSENIASVKIALDERQLKLDEASQSLLEMVARIEEKVGADKESKEAIRLLEMKIRARVLAEEQNGNTEKEETKAVENS